eukprot:g4125.t1
MAAVTEYNKTFTEDNFRSPTLKANLKIVDIPIELADSVNILPFGALINNKDDCKVEIVPWPTNGWRKLDPGTGDEGGTVEGPFSVKWKGDYYIGNNLAVKTTNNVYLDGLGKPPENAAKDDNNANMDPSHIYLWMSDYHPDGGQLFYPLENEIPFVVCLGPSTAGDDIKPSDMRAFYIPKGKGLYIHPNTWHNGIYIEKKYSPAKFVTRQGAVHARISCSWADEFGCLLRVPLKL